MLKIRRLLGLLLGLLVIFTSLGPYTAAAYAATGGSAPSGLVRSPSVIGGNLADWVLDETDGYICAYSYDHDKLLFISTADLKMKKEIKLPGISDIKLVGGKLYAARGSYRQIAVVNVKTAAIEKSLEVREEAYKIAVEGDKLFYIPRYWTGEGQPDFTKVHVLNLQDNSETDIKPNPDPEAQDGVTGGYYLNGLAADPQKHALYVSRTNGYSSGIFSISTGDYKTLSANNGERMPGLYSNILVQGNDVFFGKYRLDGGDLSRIYGSYDGSVAYVHGEYVFAAKNVFDRDKFLKIGEFPKDGDYNRYLMDGLGGLYLYEGQSYSVAAGTLEQFLSDKPGNSSTDYNADTAIGSDAASRLAISRWLVDEGRGIIYALSKENNTLMFIGLNDLKLKKQITVGKDPVDLTLAGGKLYVALSSVNQAAVVDPQTQTVKEDLVLKYRPASLAVDGNKLFYMGYEEEPAGSSSQTKYTRLYAYDLNNRTEKPVIASTPTLSVLYYKESNMVLDPARHVLYLGAPMGAGVCAINTSDYSVVGSADTFVMNEDFGLVSAAGGNVYFSVYRFAPDRLDSIYGYFKEPVVYASGSLAFSKKAVYDAGTFEKVADLPFESDCVYLDGSNNVYIFDKDLRAIKKYSLKSAIDGFGKAYKAMVENTDYSVEKEDVFNPGRKARLQNIIADDRNGVLYAISPDSFRLFVIGKDDLKVKKELMTGLAPKDMKLYNGKLYVAAAGTNYITVIDTASLTVVRKIYVSGNPELLAVDGSKLFYFGKFKLHVYDMSLNTEKELAFHDFQYDWDLNYVTDLFVDSDNHILYGVRGAATAEENFAAVSTADLKPLKLPAKVGKPGTVSLDGMPVFNGNELFSGQTVYDRSDFSVVSQGLKGKILYADDKVIITSYSAYLRNSFARLGDLPEYMDDLYVDGAKNAYNLGTHLWAIKKTSVYGILNSLVNKTTEGNSFNIDGYRPSSEETAPQPGTITFSDIASHWAKSDIESLAARHIVNGKGADGSTFSPDDRITRAEFVAMLARALGITGGESESKVFSDVDAGSWYYSPVMAASSLGLVGGRGNGRFDPNAPITRQEIAALSARILEYMNIDTGAADAEALSVFKDKNSIGGWARDSVAVAVKAGIMKGMPGGLFVPGAMSTRAEGATLLKRLLDQNLS